MLLRLIALLLILAGGLGAAARHPALSPLDAFAELTARVGDTERFAVSIALAAAGLLLLSIAGRRHGRYETAEPSRDLALYDADLAAAAPRRRFSDRGRASIVFGLAGCVMFFGGLALWSALAVVDSAAIAPGVVKVESNRLTLDHPDGGSIAELYVAEGDLVQGGDVLIRLDSAQLRAERDVLASRRDTLETLRRRLIAEQRNAESLEFPEALRARAASDPDLAEGMALQQELFDAVRDAFKAEIEAREQREVQFGERIAGLNAQLEAVARQRELVAEESADLEDLLAKGLTPQARVLALKREAANLQGRAGQLQSEIAQINSAIAEVRLSIVQMQRDRLAKISDNLRETVAELSELAPRIASLETRLARTELRAPASGAVFGLRKFTIGGTIRPGEPILEIVPEGSQLVVEARIAPVDRDVVRSGMAAKVRFTSFGFRDQQPIEAELSRISADVMEDEARREQFYVGTIIVPPGALADVAAALEPGMPAEVIIPLKSRTPLQYLLEPLLRNWSYALTEE